ncbi:class A beta-lactamase-related serine hydrolase [Chryseobacterium sp. G0162]|uniref:serine hydrolase domain-containing protein n=1 Tax=Chryseobacterium sp. G0162 TaxID=2487063 RepID=UPI000F4EEA8A|nr:serine hydrolase domain-containing protein [Chryseobacterium sp. G0162]AZB10838.1 class A beta-lactamase-related serine hydrolase [Chryseobacterium sp. G0162]
MKSPFYLLILIALVSSCQTSKKVFSENRDYRFLTDSLSIESQLEKYKLPGFSLVVFENYKIVYSNQVGVKSMDSKEKLDVNTAFSTASITKPITALLCHILEEKGLINLDEPIDKSLKRWHLPKSKFTENKSPTWRLFFNHTSGTNQGGFSDYYNGDVIPTIKQSLLGQIPRYDKEIEFLFTPGTGFEYSGGGYVIVQMALEDTFNKSIAELAQEHLFTPLGLMNTTMIQPNEKGFLTDVASVHDKDGKVIKTGLPITPQIGASGVWSTPTDLAKLSIEIQNALRNKNNKVISHQVAKRVTEVTALKDAVGGWGYGWQKSVAYNHYDWFMCNGSNTGVGGSILATMEDGNGFVILANGEKPNRIPVINEARIKLLTLMNWNKKISNKNIQELPLGLKKQLIGTYNDFLYGQGAETKIVEKDNHLYVESPFLGYFKGKNANELLYMGNGTFTIVDYPNLLKFDFSNGKVNSVILTRDSLKTEVQIIKK